MAFECIQTIRFGDVDRAGIAYYPTIFHLCHIAFEELWEKEFGLPYHVVLNDHHFGLPAVAIHSEFKEPLKFGMKIVFAVTVPRIGTKSIEFEYRLLAADDRRPLARVNITTVATDMRTFTSMSVPERYRPLLERMKS